MNWKLSLWLISVVSFYSYAIWFRLKHGSDISFSNTFYTLNKIYDNRNKGYILTGVLWLLSLPLIPIIVESHTLMFIPLALVMFIGAAPAFKRNSLEYYVHITGSIGSVIIAIFVIAISYNLYMISITTLSLVLLLYKNVIKIKNETYWVELLVIFICHLIILFKDVL